LVECYYMCQSDNGSITDTSAMRQWSNNYIRALDVRKDPRVALQMQNLLTAAGFTNVEGRMIPLPLCGWSNGKNFSSVHPRPVAITSHINSCFV